MKNLIETVTTQRGITIDQLASEMGVNRATIHNWKNRTPPVVEAYRRMNEMVMQQRRTVTIETYRNELMAEITAAFDSAVFDVIVHEETGLSKTQRAILLDRLHGIMRDRINNIGK